MPKKKKICISFTISNITLSNWTFFSDKHLHSFTFIDETYTKIFETYIKIGVSHIDAATWNTPTLE